MPINIRLLLSGLLCYLLMVQVSFAHEGRPVYIEVQQGEEGGYHLRWKIPPVLETGAEPLITLQGNQCRFISGRVQPALTGSKQYQCAIAPASEAKHPLSVSSGDAEESPIEVVLRYPQGNPALSTLIQVEQSNGDTLSVFKGPDQLRIPLPVQADTWTVASEYIQAGIAHIWAGYDHLLFVLCLMHIAGGLRRILVTITGFTLAHSVTLSLAALGVWQVRIDLIETLIALSIVMLAADVVRNRTVRHSTHINSTDKTSTLERAKQTKEAAEVTGSLIWRYPAAVAVIFGLLHGFGFASALGEIGLPVSMKIPALAFFNLGVELGQIVFVALVVALLQVIKRLFPGRRSQHENSTGAISHSMDSAPALLQLPVALLYFSGVIGAYWFVERMINLFI